MNDRESQINALAATIYTGASKLEHARKEAEGYISRAERRARKEVGKDSDRLDFLWKEVEIYLKEEIRKSFEEKIVTGIPETESFRDLIDLAMRGTK